MSDRVKVLQVLTSTQRRGAEQFAMALEGELEDRGCEVRTVALRAAEGGFEIDSLGDGISRSSLRRLRREMAAVDVTIAHGSMSLPACGIAGLATRTPFVYRNIGDPYYWGSTLRRRLQSRVLLSRAAAVVALAPTTRERLHEVYSVPLEKIETIPRGVPDDVFVPPTPEQRDAARRQFGVRVDARVALYLGSLTNEKNPQRTVAMMQHLPEWTLLVVGEGPERGAAEALAERMAPGRVIFAGSTDQPEVAHAAADVLVVSSDTEGLPGVVIEAALMGIPSISTDVGFVRDLIIDGGGVVVDEPAPEVMAAAVREVDADAAMGSVARRHVAPDYALSVVADRWADVVRRVAGQRATGGDRVNR